MDDADDVDQVAATFLAQDGPGCIAVLRERAEMAYGIGDQLSADAWTDIADAAERLLRGH